MLRLHHYSIHTKRSYLNWIVRTIRFHGMQCREDLYPAEPKIEKHLNDLAVCQRQRCSAPATQNQAVNALVFLCKRVLRHSLEGRINAVHVRKKINVPVVMTREEVAMMLSLMTGTPQMVAKLLYGSSSRIMGAVRFRVKGIDFEMKQLTVRSGKGDMDRLTTFPTSLAPLLRNHLKGIEILHQQDLAKGHGKVQLPHGLSRKYSAAAKGRGWQYVFPARNLSIDPRSGITRRHPMDPSVVNKSIKVAARRVGLAKRITCHTFRHAFAIHLLQRGTDIRTIQHLLGHQDVSTTMYFNNAATVSPVPWMIWICEQCCLRG